MDPNETLRLIRRAVMAALALADDYERDPDPATAEDAEDYLNQLDELAQLVNSLDEWLSRGGFFPDAWGKDLLREAVAAQLREGQVPYVEPGPYSDPDLLPNPPEPLGPPNPAHASSELLEQLDADLTRAGEIVRRMRKEH